MIYDKVKYSGNENGWHEPKDIIGKIVMHESNADELNSHFRSTGVKYELPLKVKASK
jgi:hypothetical protein